MPLRTLAAFAVLCLAAPVFAQSLPAWAQPSHQTTADAKSDDVEGVRVFRNTMAAPPTPPGGPAAPVPLDGGLTLLALAGAGLAARRLRS